MQQNNSKLRLTYIAIVFFLIGFAVGVGMFITHY